MTVPEEAQLVMVEGPDRGRRHPLRGTVVIGRGEEATIFVDDSEVSRKHARISRSEDGFVIEDLCSRNGTAVAGRRIAVPTLLCYGDCIRLGNQVELLFTERRRRDDPAPQRRRETLDRLSASAAYDLGNKLAAARASLDYLCALPRNTPLGAVEVQECLADLALSIGESVDLLPWLQAAEPHSDREGVTDVSRIMADLAAYLGQSFGVDLVASRVEAELVVRGDSTSLYEAFLELAIRAREATPANGRVSLAARKQPLSRFDRRRGRVLVTIRGLSDGVDDTLGEPLHEPAWLSPIAAVVTKYGGRLRANEGGGLWSFEIDLALHEVSRPLAHSGETAAASPRAPKGRGPVLVVHDERVVRSALARVLVGADIEVIEVHTHDAVEALRESAVRIPVAVVEDGPGPEGGSLVDALAVCGRGVRLVVMKGRGPTSSRASSRHRLPAPWTAETVLTAVERFLALP